MLSLLCLISCYDAPRTNPFDPALTPAVELLAVTVDSTSGSALLEWSPYEGQQPFQEYRVLRQVKRLVDVDTVAKITDVRQTSFRDTTPEPEVEYAYWVEVVNQGGFNVKSESRAEVVYALPGVELREAKFSSDTATAELVWSQYRGPNFATYEVRRKAPELEEKKVEEVEEVSDTTYTDTLLDGNTEYTYHIVVRTGWEGVEVFSNERSGKFYPFVYDIRLPEIPGVEPQAIGLAIDEQDQLYVGMTTISAAITQRSFRAMQEGLWVRFPSGGLKHFFSNVTPGHLSPIHLAASQEKVYVSVQLEDGKTMVGAIDENRELWGPQEAGSDIPAGIHIDEDGTVLMLDNYAVLRYFLPNDGSPERPGILLRELLLNYQPLPVGWVVVGQKVGKEGGDQFFVLAPDQRDHYLRAITRLPGTRFRFDESTLIPIDEGIGAKGGQLLTPVTLAFDRQRTRLLVLEVQGRLQVFDARPEVEYRYITQLGQLGTGDGEFLVSVPVSAAVVVDSQGMIYVTDGVQIQVFSP